MSFAKIVGHQQPIEILRRAIAEDRLATAYLFVGPRNVGKTLVATEFAKAVNCEARAADTPASEIDACDQCHNCVRIEQENHPDLLVVRPAVAIDVREPGAERDGESDERDGADRAEDEADRARVRSAKRAVYIELPDALIQTGRVREVVEYAHAKRVAARRKFLLIIGADTMNSEAANRLLKTLEEPPADTTFILTTSRPEHLLPTIISRCQVVRFHALPGTQVRAALQERFPEAAAELLDAATAMAGGRFGLARRLIDSPELMRLRAELLDLAVATADAGLVECLALGERLMALPEAWWAASEGGEAAAASSEDERALRTRALEDLAKKSPDRISRIQMEQILDVLQTWYRDLTLLRSAASPELLINVDRQEQLARLAPEFAPAGLVWASEVIEETRRDLSAHNANLRLACQVLMVKLIAARRRR